jgi:hypothetical protein
MKLFFTYIRYMDANTGINNNKIIILLSVGAIIAATSYYYFIYKPTQLTPEKKFTRILDIIKEE